MSAKVIQQLGESQRSVLRNGLRVVTVYRPGTQLAGVKLFFKVGSRHDGHHPGIAHCLEHLLLANTSSPAAQMVYQAVEMLGGELNATTTREYTALQAVVLKPHVETVVNLFADVLEPRPLDPPAVERERRVILEEIRLTTDSYQILWDLFLEALWDSHPLARPIIGTRESLAALTDTMLQEHLRHYRAADRIVLAAAGDIDHDALTRVAESRFGPLSPGPPIDNGSCESAPKRWAFLEKETHQTHLAIGVEAAAMPDPRRYAVRLLDILLGWGAGSRLHRALRTERGLVYTVSSVAMSFADRGYLAVYTASAPENTRVVYRIILDELDRIGREGVSEAELVRAKTIYEGSLARSFETVLSVASIIGIEELLHRIEPFSDSVARVREVSARELQRVAAELLAPDRRAIAAVGRRPFDA